MATDYELKATAKKMRDRLVLITFWMEEVLLDGLVITSQSMRKPSSEKDCWHSTVKLRNARFCTLYLEEHNNRKIRLCGKILKTELQNDGNVVFVEAFREGINQSQVAMKLSETTWWDTHWVNGNLVELPFNQLLLSFSSPMDSRATLPSIEEESLIERPIRKGEEAALERLSTLFEEKFLADVTFVVEGENIAPHGAIAAADSPVLSAMFQQNKDRLVKIEGTQPRVFKQLLQYLYTGAASDVERLDSDWENIVDLLVAAHITNTECNSSKKIVQSF